MTLILHATSVAVKGRAIVIVGPSGAGKSALALALIGQGAGLIADDRTELQVEGDALIAVCPPAISGMLEVRGMGILNAPIAAASPVALVVDLAQVESDRLPPLRTITYLERTVPLVRRIDAAHFPAALLHYMSYGRRD